LHTIRYVSLTISLLWTTILSAGSGDGLIADSSWNTHITTQQQQRQHTITGGIQQGANLFHSFQAFNLEMGETADFQTLPKTQHIISRVTGGQDSWLNGRLQVSGSDANLYLLNPQGILLGQHANLDMRGSLHISTANQLILNDNTRLPADRQTGVRLSVAPPEAFGFLTSQAAPIQIVGAHLSLHEGKHISLAGGNLTLSDDTRIQADAGQIQLTAVHNTGTVALDGNHDISQSADIRLTDTALVTSNHTHSQQTGRIALYGDQVQIVRSKLDAHNQSPQNTEAVGLLIDATEIQLQQHSTVNTTTTGAGQAGAIHLHASERILLATGTELHAMTLGQGAGGTVHLQADQQVWLQDGDIWAVTTSIQPDAGQGGNVQINAADIRLSDGGQIWARTEGAGDSGSVSLHATQQIQLQGRDASQQEASGITVSTISTQPQAGAGGHVKLNAADILITDSAGILAETWGKGTGGSISLQASNQIIVTGTDPTGYRSSGVIVNSSGQMAGAGASGTLNLHAREIHIHGDAGILASTSSSGTGGSVTLSATERILLRGSQFPGNQLHGITVSTENPGDQAGAGGHLNLYAPDIRLEQGSQILAKTQGAGDGGSVNLQAGQQLTLSGSTIYASAEPGTTSTGGHAGHIRLAGRHILLADGSILASDSQSNQAEAGNIALFAQDTITLRGGSKLTTTAHSAGGGSITLQAQERIWLQDSHISTSVRGGAGRGGNIAIDPIFILLENSQLQANAHGGAGGNIHLQANYLLNSGPVRIEASSALSTSGNIQIQAVTLDSANLVTTQSIAPLNIQRWQEPACHQQTGRTSRLVMSGYDAHPTPMNDILSALPIWLTRQTHHRVNPHSGR
jgi:filamentous hemagglutinin family protein